MKNLIQLKRLTSQDLSEMRDLNEVFAKAFQDDDTHLSKVASDKYLTQLLSKEHFIALVAKKNEQVVGGIVAYVLEKYEQERSEVYIYDLAVDELFRRQKIATQLITELKKIAKSLGAWVIFVQADRTDLPAVKLYQSLGQQEEPLHFDIDLNLN